MRSVALVLVIDLVLITGPMGAQTVTVAHLSDLHIDIAHHPGSEERLQHAIDMIRKRHVDAVIITGDIGDSFEHSWSKARAMLASLNLPVYYVPGNHDNTAKTTARYNVVFGKDYYTFSVRGIQFVALDSQLLGSFNNVRSTVPEAVSKDDEAAAETMLEWLSDLRLKRPVIALQHVPPDRPSAQTSPDDKPYWILHNPWRRRELDALRKLGVKHILAGHWHQGSIYDVDGFTIHVAPATSWSPRSPVGFALHTINVDGKVNTEFLYFEQQPFSRTSSSLQPAEVDEGIFILFFAMVEETAEYPRQIVREK